MLTPSIEKRATDLILQGMDVLEAVKQALIDENNMIGSLIAGSKNFTERGQIARDEMYRRFQDSQVRYVVNKNPLTSNI